jgi:hypothetical protein
MNLQRRRRMSEGLVTKNESLVITVKSCPRACEKWEECFQVTPRKLMQEIIRENMRYIKNAPAKKCLKISKDLRMFYESCTIEGVILTSLVIDSYDFAFALFSSWVYEGGARILLSLCVAQENYDRQEDYGKEGVLLDIEGIGKVFVYSVEPLWIVEGEYEYY